MKYQRKKTSAFVFLVTFVYMLMQTRCWIGFGGVLKYSHAFVFLFLILAGFIGWVKYEFKRKYIALGFVYLLTWVSIYYNGNGNFNFLLFSSLPALNIFLVLCIPDENKSELLAFWIKGLGCIIILALPIYFLSFVVELPSLGVVYADYDGVVTDKRLNNFFFLLKPLETNYSIFRFSGPLIEPGDLGCLCTFLLFAAQYDLKKYKYLWAVLAGVIVSFSLAGWLMSIVGYAMIMVGKKKISIKTVALASFVFLVVIMFGLYYNGGNNLVNELFLSRLHDNSEAEGNVRVAVECELYFFALLSSGDLNLILHGYGLDSAAAEAAKGAGYMQFVVLHGFLGIIYMLIPYIIMIFIEKRRYARYATMFLVMAILYLIQRAELYWICYVVPHIFGIIVDGGKCEGNSIIEQRMTINKGDT